MRRLILGILVLLCLLPAWPSGAGQSTLAEVIQWKWPGAQVVVRGEVIERWDGPMPRPTDAELAKAQVDYAAVATDVQLDKQANVALDQERLISAVVWTVIDTYSPPATKAKYTAARAKIIDVYKTQPWK